MRSFDASLPMALLRAREAAMQLFRPLLSQHDLTEQQWRVLRAVGSAPEPVEVGVLAERTSLLAPSLTRIVADLVRRSLIVRVTPPHDRRRAVLSLSDEGFALVALVAPQSEERYNMIEEAFGADRLHALIGELHAFAGLSLTQPQRSESVL